MAIKVKFYPGVKDSDLDFGVMSEISWQRCTEQLEKLFSIKENERILGITVTEYSIKARIETTDEGKLLRATVK